MYDTNDHAVWGTISSGGGHAQLNETLSTLNIPQISCKKFSDTEEKIGDLRN